MRRKPRCTKIKYKSKAGARRSLRHSKLSHKMRAYRCDRCGLYHLTKEGSLMSDNGQGTTTQGQSIPTALFDKMFAKDKGMPGRNELESTIQDRSESSESEARWNRCVTPQIAQLARVDVTLHTVLQLWRQDMSRSFQMVATEYLKTGANLAEMAGKVGIGADVWARAWPKWPTEPGAIRRTEQEVIAIAQCMIVEAAILARDVMRAMGEMMKLKIPEPIKVTREQAIALGINPETESKS